jgi:TonB family protein
MTTCNNPKSPSQHTAKVVLRILLGAIILLATPLTLRADKAGKNYKRALKLRKSGELAEAKHALEESLRLKPNFDRARILLGLTCYQLGEGFKAQGDMPQALTEMKEATRQDPEEAYWHSGLAQIFQAMGRSEDAAKEYDEAARLSPLDQGLKSWRESAPATPPTNSDKLAKDSPVPSRPSKIDPPVLQYRPNPPYSEKARYALLEGTVFLKVVVNAKGDVEELRVDKPLGLGLDQKALETVSTWKFEPAKRDDVPVRVKLSVEAQFKLHK